MTGDPLLPGPDEHDDHGGHDHPHGHAGGAHGPEPLPGVDTGAMHAAVDALAAALHDYVDTAAGVRAEFGASEADEDPRVLALESRVSGLNARLYDLLHESLGMHSELTGMTWEEPAPAEAPAADEDTDEFHLGFVVSVPAATGDQSIDAVLGIVDNGGAEIVERLLDSGFTVEGWGASRGAPVSFDDDEDDEA
ncbi:hypothetical protein [Cellulomonas pakistanensis]|uniref:Uncharacterized protein n=1 Tax=Cellulomonas pakistanensis TaxID=992287 RepID=A0A919U6K5_9CELL|nr:hypothetical protein [Cellulomonas pakistanensis]GIG36355.1 hypothetical protein Cpa01nite_17360 [Cellulomonas pakistanensis]